MNNLHVVILAGGAGTRFWPLSRASHPKQFLSITPSGESLIQATVRRIKPLITNGHLWIVTNEQQVEHVKKHVPDANVITEPYSRNTAASIALATSRICSLDKEAVVVTLAADHAVQNEDVLRQAIQRAAEVASEKQFLVTIGIEPTTPNTAYGYIQKGDEILSKVFKVNRFYEKPNLDRAKQYLSSNQYLWNSSMFAWRVDTITSAFKEFMPELYGMINDLQTVKGTEYEDRLKKIFEGLESISIDFGVMEHAKNCVVIPGEKIGWSDVGSWDAWADLFTRGDNGNLENGDTLLIDSKDCVVYSKNKLTAVIGLEDVIVINSDDALLVVPRDRVQDVKKVVEELGNRKRKDLL